MNPKKIWLIAKREYLFNLRRKSFLFTMFATPIFIVFAMWLGGLLGQQAATDISAFTRVGVVDQAGLLTESTGAPVVQVKTPFVLISTLAQAEAEFENGALDGYYVLPKDYLSKGQADAYYRPEKVFTGALADELLASLIKPALARRVGDPALTERLESPLEELAVYRLGSDIELDPNAVFAAVFVPIVLGMLVFSLTLATSQYLMQGLVEEKENRMMELFVTSARPSEMLWGKLLGLGGLGLTQIGVWVLMGLAFALISGTVDFGRLLATYQLTPSFLLGVLVYSMLGYMLNGAVMAGIGASVSAEQESRQIASLLSLVGLLPIILLFVFFDSPNGTIPVLLSLIPFTAPIGMILRSSLVIVPPAEIALSIGLLIVAVIVVMWLSARIFRLGMLNYGKRLSLRDIFRALREGRQSIVSAAHGQEVAS